MIPEMSVKDFDNMFSKYLKVRVEIRSNPNVSMKTRYLAAHLAQRLRDEGFGHVIDFELPALEKRR